MMISNRAELGRCQCRDKEAVLCFHELPLFLLFILAVTDVYLYFVCMEKITPNNTQLLRLVVMKRFLKYMSTDALPRG